MQISGSSLQDQGANVKTVTLASFQRDVIEASATRPVLVDFWAPWCAPCRQLTPLLEKLLQESSGSFDLVKIDVDQEGELARQMHVQSLPTVITFLGGQPVDGFTGLLSFQELISFLEKINAMMPRSPEAILQEAEEKLDKNETSQALQIFTNILMTDPQNSRALLGMVRGYLQEGDLAKAKGYWGLIPLAMQEQQPLVKKALDLAEQGQAAGDLSDLLTALEQDPLNHEKRALLAKGLFAQGQHQQAMDQLFIILNHDFQWNHQQARSDVLNFIEALGHTHPLALQARKRLSTLIFT